MTRENIISKAKEFMEVFETEDIDKILSFYSDDAEVIDVGIALAFDKPLTKIKGKKKYKEFLERVKPKTDKMSKAEIIAITADDQRACIEFRKNDMRWCEVLTFRGEKIVSNRGYWCGLPPKNILKKIQKL